ncbi:hypothetical protein Y032_0094g2735 [Ancylostoma ceylanicum]|uniref:Uncharacterized protein n=1 Tax=Ancylostoma ceylanicum TaxID=53326 RepID=A0A016TL39_9BILA|nr:hypothetical protein Y032_0094g2735 [Ancylostoma ceylanicum]
MSNADDATGPDFPMGRNLTISNQTVWMESNQVCDFTLSLTQLLAYISSTKKSESRWNFLAITHIPSWHHVSTFTTFYRLQI